MSTEKKTSSTTGVKTKIQPPSLYKVIMHNDDYTTMEFVVHILQKVFNKTSNEAYRIMMIIHRSGSAVCGIYPHAIAETKIAEVEHEAQANDFPLNCSMEKN